MSKHNFKYNASNKKENSNTNGVSLFWSTLYMTTDCTKILHGRVATQTTIMGRGYR